MRCPRRLSNDFLLPTMITFLNDRDWQTRAAFFRDVACMAAHAGFAGMEAFLLPCVEQARLIRKPHAIHYICCKYEAG
jgi:phosphoinositide-3-kinase regulatory subunit 4